MTRKPPPPPDAEWLSVSEVAARMRVAKMTIYRGIDNGEIPGAIRFGTRVYRINAATFEAYLTSLTDGAK